MFGIFKRKTKDEKQNRPPLEKVEPIAKKDPPKRKLIKQKNDIEIENLSCIENVHKHAELIREIEELIVESVTKEIPLPFNTRGRMNTSSSLMNQESTRRGAVLILEQLKENFTKSLAPND